MSISSLKKSIQSIKMLLRTTNAMRVLSMSLHSSLKKEIENRLEILKLLIEKKEKFKINEKIIKFKKKINVFLGSEKGLCGSYNHEVKKIFIENLNNNNLKELNIIVGKKLISDLSLYLTKKENYIFFEKFSQKNLKEIKNFIYEKSKNFDKIILFYVNSKNLFNQTIEKKEIICNFEIENENFLNFKKEEIISAFSKIYIKSNINYILYNALASEEASRFVSMDGACNNAKKIIKEKELFYNKKRQSLITNGSLDLIGNFFSKK